MSRRRVETVKFNPGPRWTFLTNHAHVLVCLRADPGQPLRAVALEVGVTERAVQRIVAELEEAGVIRRYREGRRNRYELNPAIPLRHPLEAHRTVGDLLAMVAARPTRFRGEGARATWSDRLTKSGGSGGKG